MENPCDFVIRLSDQCHKLSYTRTENGKLLRPHTFGKPALAQKVTSKISAFIRKSYLEKDLRSVTTNVAMYLTLIKTEEYPTPHPQKQALDPLFKDNRI